MVDPPTVLMAGVVLAVLLTLAILPNAISTVRGWRTGRRRP